MTDSKVEGETKTVEGVTEGNPEKTESTTEIKSENVQVSEEKKEEEGSEKKKEDAKNAASSISLRPGGGADISLRPGGGLGISLRPGGNMGSFSLRPAGPSFTAPDGSAKKPVQLKPSPNRKVLERARPSKRDRRVYTREQVMSMKSKCTALPSQSLMDRIPGVFTMGDNSVEPQSAVSGSGSAGGSGKTELKNQAADKWVPPSMRSGMNFTIDQEEIRKEKYVEAVRYVQGLLNRVTPENFGTISEQLVRSYEDSAGHEALLKEHCLLVFEKALSEPNYASMWGDLCTFLSGDPKKDAKEDDIHTFFRKEVLNMCQREFEFMKQEYKKSDDSYDVDVRRVDIIFIF